MEDSDFESRQKREIFVPAKVQFLSGGHIFSYLIATGIFPWGKKGKKVKAVCGSYSTAALRHIVLLPE